MPLERFVLGPNRHYVENGFTLAHASAAAYEADPKNYTQWNELPFDRYEAFDIDETSTQGFVAASDQNTVVVFRGTEYSTLIDLQNDLNALQKRGYGGRVHQGFAEAFESAEDTVKDLLARFRDNGQNLFFTGHSLGAALATLAAWEFRRRNPTGLVSFGSPRVGDPDFAANYPITTKRWVNNRDVVAQVPFEWSLGLRYKHVANPVLMKRNGDIETTRTVWSGVKDLFQDAVAAASAAKIEMFEVQGLEDHKIDNYIAKIDGNL